MYMVASLVDEVLQEALEDYVAVSHAGHGINSYSINYALVSGPLTLFLQTGWGGGYMDADRSAANVREMFAGADALIDALNSFPEMPGRLVVVSSDFGGVSSWGWTEGPNPTLDVGEWLTNHQPPSALEEAIRWIDAKP
jgi:hypothetical protein